MSHNVLGIGSCRILTPLYKVFKDSNNTNVVIYNCLENFFEKMTFTGNHFLGKLHNSKEVIQFIKLIRNEISISDKILSLFLTSFSRYRAPTVPRETNPRMLLDNIKNVYDKISTVFIEISSIKIYEFEEHFVNLEHIASCNPYIDHKNYKSIMKIQTKDDLINDLKIIIDVLKSKNIIFVTHFNIDNIVNRAIIKEAIQYVVLNYNYNNNLYIIEPIEILGKQSLMDDKLHLNFNGMDRYKNFLLQYIQRIVSRKYRVTVLQCDNRKDNDMVIKSVNINRNACKSLNYEYKFIDVTCTLKKYKLNHSWSKMNYILAKIFVVNEYINTYKTDFVVFLDTDAWIQEKYYLDQLLHKLYYSTYNGAFSRDPYVWNATYINSGSFIIKVNDFIKSMYNNIIKTFNNFGAIDFDKNNMILHKTDKHDSYKKCFGDQYFISNYVYNNKNNFLIFEPPILNTPDGTILRHHWWKHIKLYEDANEILHDYIFKIDNYTFDTYLDSCLYPCTEEQNRVNSYCFPLETAIKYNIPP